MNIDMPHEANDVFNNTVADEAELRSQVLNKLLNVSTYLVSVLDPDELLLNLTERVVAVVPAVQAGLLWLYDRPTSSLRVSSLHGLEQNSGREALLRLQLRPGEGLPGTVLQNSEPVLAEGRGRYREIAGQVTRRNQSDIWLYLDSLPRELTAVFLPLRIGTEVIGVMELLNLGNPPALTRSDIQVLQTFGNLAAGAIKNAHLHSQMQAHQRRLEAFGAIGTAVSTAADLEELMSNALDVILSVVNASASALFLLDPNITRLRLSIGAQRGLPAAFIEHQHHTFMNDAPYEEAIRYGQPIRRLLIAEGAEDILIDAGMVSCVYIPLLVGGTVVGIIGIYGDETLHERVDVQALMTMASLVGFAIANVRLYQESQIERRKLSAVINSIAEGVVLCNGEGRLVLANQTAMELLSIENVPYDQPLSEMPDFYMIRDIEGEKMLAERLPLARALSGEIFHDYRVLIHGVSGPNTVMSFSGAPVNSDEGSIEGAVVIFRDITKSQRIEAARNDFLAVAAHELRSPLAAVRSYTDMLVRREQRRSEEPSSELRGLNLLAQQVTHMLGMVDHLLDVTRVDKNLLNLQLQRSDLLQLTQQVINQQRPAAGDRELILESDAHEMFVNCDPIRIRQVITNMVGNAIRYSPTGTKITIRISSDRADQLMGLHPGYALCRSDSSAGARSGNDYEVLAVICVQDQGAGISEEQMARLFKRYSRGSERRGEGLGLGLYLCWEFVTRHRGHIWVESRENQGSMFYVTLPLDQEAEDSASSPQAGASDYSLSGPAAFFGRKDDEQ